MYTQAYACIYRLKYNANIKNGDSLFLIKLDMYFWGLSCFVAWKISHVQCINY